MVIIALATQAKPSSADTLSRFLATSGTYLALQADRHQGRLAGSEFIDPPRYRCAFQVPARRALA